MSNYVKAKYILIFILGFLRAHMRSQPAGQLGLIETIQVGVVTMNDCRNLKKTMSALTLSLSKLLPQSLCLGMDKSIKKLRRKYIHHQNITIGITRVTHFTGLALRKA